MTGINRDIYMKEVVKNCPCYCHVDGSCSDSLFRCTDITSCTMKRIVSECLLYKENTNTGNEAWLLANVVLLELGVEE